MCVSLFVCVCFVSTCVCLDMVKIWYGVSLILAFSQEASRMGLIANEARTLCSVKSTAWIDRLIFNMVKVINNWRRTVDFSHPGIMATTPIQ